MGIRPKEVMIGGTLYAVMIDIQHQPGTAKEHACKGCGANEVDVETFLREVVIISAKNLETGRYVPKGDTVIELIREKLEDEHAGAYCERCMA
ncbi:MAG: hypothetical protein PHW75_01730 [Patescibacteria group bacterium]|nr:hypothetical protein [Patescibacteria group bacterium]